MSLLPMTSAASGALGFFAGAAGGASLATTMGACCIGGVILWPFGLALQLAITFGTKEPSLFFPTECMASVPAAGIGALVCSLPLAQTLVAASVGAALLYVLGNVIYISSSNEHQSPASYGVALHVAGYEMNF